MLNNIIDKSRPYTVINLVLRPCNLMYIINTVRFVIRTIIPKNTGKYTVNQKLKAFSETDFRQFIFDA